MLTSLKGPLAERYSAAVALVLVALAPFPVLTTAAGALTPLISHDTGLSARALGLTSGMANAAYAFGAVLAVQLAARLPQRRLLVAFSSIFVVGSVLAAWSPVAGLFVVGHVLQGLATGLMLIAAVPPLILTYGKEKLPITAFVLNIGLFGAVALGPAVGGAASGTGMWRILFWIVAGLGGVGLILTLATFRDDPPREPSRPVDLVALGLAGGGCASLFFGVSELPGRQAYAPVVLGPTVLGLVLIISLLLHQFLAEDPLIPVRKLLHTVPIAAIIIAMSAAAGSVGLVELTQAGLGLRHQTPSHTGMLLLPEFGAAFVASILFGVLLFTRWTLLLALGGLLVLAGGGIIVTGVASGSDTPALIGSALIGFGVGSSVSPALFLAGFSLPSGELPRIFAVVGLLRGVAAFLVGPVLIQLATATGGAPQAGNRTAIWVAIAIVAAGAVVAMVVLALGRHRLRAPDIDPWMNGDQPALASAPLGDALRENPTQYGGMRQLPRPRPHESA